MSRGRRDVRVLAAGVAAALLMIGCSGDDDAPAPAPTTSSAAARTTPAPEPVWPLTGLPTGGAEVTTPVLTVKIDNTGAAEPQVGLSAADLVVQELVEGGLTRLAAMYHSSVPDVVGPVRSVRNSDIAIVAPTGGALAASGGASRVLRDIDDAGLTVLTEGDPGFSRAGDRRGPYNVMLEPAAAIASVTQLAPPAAPYLPWGPELTEGDPVTGVDIAFSGGRATSWTWAGGVWSHTGDLAADGDEFGPANLLVLRVTTRDAGYEDPGGNPVPETVLEGSGEALLLSGGFAVAGQWSKGAAAEPLTLTAAGGEALTVPAGRTWVALVPEGGAVTTR